MSYFLSKKGIFIWIIAVISSGSFAQVPIPAEKQTTKAVPAEEKKILSDSALLDLVQQQTFKYFWDFADPVSGLARERSNKTPVYGNEVVTTGGSGFGIMAIIVATERQWITRDSAVKHLLKSVNFLSKANSYHGIFPHWLNGSTGITIPFSRKDDGADIVETAYLFEGLLCARQYFNQQTPLEKNLRNRINTLWKGAEWSWHQREGGNEYFWHWSPNNGWSMNAPIRGWNECLIAYVLGASSPTYPITESVYRRCWAVSDHFINGRTYYGVKIPLGFDYGGPLFFAHYSFMGLNPHGLKDRYADYWEQNYNHTLINYKYCVDNPKQFKGYGENCWGLTASDTYDGYNAQSPDNDFGTITPTAALSSFPYTPEYSMKALKHFYYDLGGKIWGPYGFTDAFNESKNWYAESYLAIDEGPIVVMIENYRTGLLWKLFMSCDEVHQGLQRLDFQSTNIK
jgi:hypothetical protein